MEEENICPGRSALALKQQFLQHAMKRLSDFDVTEDVDDRQEQGTTHTSDRDNFADSASSRGSRSEATYYIQADDEVFRPFSSADLFLYIAIFRRLSISFWTTDDARTLVSGEVTLWQVMEERGVVEGRSWQSLKERFKKSIVKRLDLFELDEQQEEQLS